MKLFTKLTLMNPLVPSKDCSKNRLVNYWPEAKGTLFNARASKAKIM